MARIKPSIVFDNLHDTDQAMRACLNFKQDMSYGYIQGYKQAADLLIEHIARDGTRHLDTLVYPICNLYRHYIEIHIKQILTLLEEKIGDACAYRQARADSKNRHSLKHWWDFFCKTIEQQGISVDHLNRVGFLVEELDSIDKFGLSFRYYTDIKNSPQPIVYTESQKHVKYCALDILFHEMQEIGEWLSALEISAKELDPSSF